MEDIALGQLPFARNRRRPEHRCHLLIIGLQRVPSDDFRPTLVVEYRRIRTDEDVGVNQRTPTYATGHDRPDTGKKAYVVESGCAPVLRVLPKQPVDVPDVSGEVSWRVATSAFQNDRRLARLRQSKACD